MALGNRQGRAAGMMFDERNWEVVQTSVAAAGPAAGEVRDSLRPAVRVVETAAVEVEDSNWHDLPAQVVSLRAEERTVGVLEIMSAKKNSIGKGNRIPIWPFFSGGGG